MSEAPTYAKVAWTAHDVQTLRPRWTLAQCEQALADNEKYVQERLVELGWEVLDALLDHDQGAAANDDADDLPDADRREEATAQVLCRKLLHGGLVQLSDTGGSTPMLTKNIGALSVLATDDGEYHGEYISTETAFTYQTRNGSIGRVLMGELCEAQPLGEDGFLLPNGNELWVHGDHWALFATFVPQAETDRGKHIVDIDPRRFVDVTVAVLSQNLAAIQALQDDQLESDRLVDVDALGHRGPYRVEIEAALCSYFGVDSLGDISQGQLDTARDRCGICSAF
jgi:hypothetical protein